MTTVADQNFHCLFLLLWSVSASTILWLSTGKVLSQSIVTMTTQQASAYNTRPQNALWLTTWGLNGLTTWGPNEPCNSPALWLWMDYVTLLLAELRLGARMDRVTLPLLRLGLCNSPTLWLTTWGLNGAGTSFLSSFSQLTLLKKAWDLICLSPPNPGWHPSLRWGFFTRNCTKQWKRTCKLWYTISQ